MIRKFTFTVIWFFVFFIGMAVAVSVGAMIFGKSTDSYGQYIGKRYGILMILTSFILSSILCFKNKLPGTRNNK